MRLSIMGSFLLCLAAAGLANAQEKQSVRMNGNIPGPKQFEDSLMMTRHAMGSAYRGFQSPKPETAIIDWTLQAALDAKKDGAQPRRDWALVDTAAHDTLGIEVREGRPELATERDLRAFAAEKRKWAAEGGLVLDQDTVEWRDAVHEYRMRAHNTKTNEQWMIRRLSSADTRPTPTTLTYTAYGPTAAATFSRTVDGMMLSKYIGPRPGPAPREAQGAPGTAAMAAQPVSHFNLAGGVVTNDFIGMRASIPPRFVFDSARQRLTDQVAMGNVLSRMYWDPAAAEAIRFVGYVHGEWSVDSVGWTKRAQDELTASLRYPGNRQVGRVAVDWHADTASFRFTVVDANGMYLTRRCIGSAIGRMRAAAVCVFTISKDPNAFEDVLDGLVLTPPSMDLGTRSPEEQQI